MLSIAAVGDMEQWLASATHGEPAQKGVATCNHVSDSEEHCAATGAQLFSSISLVATGVHPLPSPAVINLCPRPTLSLVFLQGFSLAQGFSGSWVLGSV